MTDLEIKNKLNAALDKLHIADHYLLEKAAHERSIAHRLAVYLEELFPDFDVDCEYNLNIENISGYFPGKKEIDALKDKLENIKSHKNQHLNETFHRDDEVWVALKVYPDIIIHKRQTNKLNILVIEIKKSKDQSKMIDEFDQLKLESYTESGLNYQLGAYINLSVSNNHDRKSTEIEYYQHGHVKSFGDLSRKHDRINNRQKSSSVTNSGDTTIPPENKAPSV